MLNLRASITSYASAHASPRLDSAEKRREYLPARDVKWSIGHWDHIIATAATNGRIALYDINAPSAKTELAWLHEHTGQINKLDIDPHAGYLLLSASQDKSVRLWDLRDPKAEKSRARFEVRGGVRDVRWSPVEPFDFAVCADGGVIQKWDARAPTFPKLSINAHEKACYSLDYHPDGRHIISGGFDKYIRVWDFDSDRKRQKASFQLKAPHPIRNIRWRPACSTSDSTESSAWQSTQVAVSYHQVDPRIHIWDLRRPLLPFRELDRYSTPANDLVWADTNLLWTVGDDGIFTQWDVAQTTPFYNQLSPCTSTFLADGQFYSFLEDRQVRRASSHDDPAARFLSIPRDKLSSEDDGLASTSLTDDEGGPENTAGTNIRRRDGGITPRSNKSQANSPPSMEDRPPILSLDRSLLNVQDLFSNDQIGAFGYIPGIAAEPQVVEYLASHYATPATADENASSPQTILERLEKAFLQNAAACETVSMYRMAQSWRILSAVIVPELRDWADTNRAERRADAARRREALENFRQNRPGLSPLAGLPNRGSNSSKHDVKGSKLMSSLFKSAAGVVPNATDVDSTSNMTTPLAKPLPISPPTTDKRWTQLSMDDALDNLPPLPPSMLNSHSTAAAAARALLDSPDRMTGSDTSSPERYRSAETMKRLLASTNSPVSAMKRSRPEIFSDQEPAPAPSTMQDHRRAALRDYRAQARPIFTLGASTQETSSRTHDSAESFPMFSVSTDSSQKARSAGQSFDSPHDPGRRPTRRMASDLSSDHDVDPEMSFTRRLSDKSSANRRLESSSGDRQSGLSAAETPPEMSFEAEAKIFPITGEEDKDTWRPSGEHDLIIPSHLGTAVSSSPDIFHFETGLLAAKPRIHMTNPLRTEHTSQNVGEPSVPPGTGLLSRLSLDELDCATHLYQDFRPIDLARYEPKLPFAWSSLPLICQCISFDLENGIGNGQFAAHLLMHVHQYFFDSRFWNMKQQEDRIVDNLADRLMTPQIGHRVIGSILENHLSLLQKMGLFDSAALVRKIGVALDYSMLSLPRPDAEKTGGSVTNGDSSALSIVCSRCQAPMSAGRNTCDRCRQVRSVCPICQSIREDYHSFLDREPVRGWGQNKSMWTFCQACGHSGHVRCLMEWFSQAFSEGACPTLGCGCDCGPGLTRDGRIQQQSKREDETRLIRGSSPGHSLGTSTTKRDPLKATASPAVDKARVALRNSFAGDRATQSGDERSLPGKRSNSRGRASGFGSSRKSVRLITPGEEESR